MPCGTVFTLTVAVAAQYVPGLLLAVIAVGRCLPVTGVFIRRFRQEYEGGETHDYARDGYSFHNSSMVMELTIDILIIIFNHLE